MTPTGFPRAGRPHTLPAPQSPVTHAQRESPRRTPGPAACQEPEGLKFSPTPASAYPSNSGHTSPPAAVPAEAPALPPPARRSRGAQRVFLTMGTADSDEMAPETPQPTHVDVHIHQESALAKLLLTCCSALRPLATQARGSSRLLVTSWVMQIVLGILSGVLGGFLYMRGFTLLVSSGAAIWTGAVAVLAGVAAFIYETRRGTYWSLLRSVLDLAAFCTAVAALKLWNADLGYNNYYSSMCNISTSSYWYNTPAPTKSPEEVRRLQLCISLLDMLEALFITLQAMLLAVWILLLLASLAPLGLYCWRIFSDKKKKDKKEMLEVSGI
nr:transmembrane protein 176A isoform X2 [Callithrix jacchus]